MDNLANRYSFIDAQQLGFFNEAGNCNDASEPELGKTTAVKAHALKNKQTQDELIEDLEDKKIVCDLPEQEQPCEEVSQHLGTDWKKFDFPELVITSAQVYGGGLLCCQLQVRPL